MAGRSYNQRHKALLVFQILLRQTDKDHPLKIGEIKKQLSNYGIEANVHSIGRDIKELQRLYSAEVINDFDEVEDGERIPYKIEYDGSGERGYKVTKRPCKFSDLQLLVECIHSARFISQKQEKRLFETIAEFCSEWQYQDLNNETYLVDRSKTNNNNILSYINTINAAIKENKKIKFKYMKYTLQNREAQTPRRNGAFYTVSPFKILINEGNFYLLAYNGKYITTYRIDRMDNVIKSIELREGAEFYKDINMQDFTKRVFSMFGGEEKNVTIRFTNDLLDIVIDRFGANGASYTPDDDKHFKIHVNVEVSNMFYSWICGFRKKATILNPPEVVEDFKTFLADINQKYESC
ncbi:MAG: WYL domain-containing protein [Clostridia bacterium]|nr:WYL domain-containing protein [Clostridia bacterium]